MRYLIITIILLTSCNKTENEIPYHQFNETDLNFLPTYYEDIGSTTIFTNANNEETSLEVTRYHLSKETSGGIGTGNPLEYYDQLEIELKIPNADCDYKKIKINKTLSDTLIIWFDLSSKIDPCNTYEIIRFDSPFKVSEMTIDGFVYKKVMTINSENSIYFGTDYEIDKIYFDFKYGFIGFDDVNGIQFRRAPQ